MRIAIFHNLPSGGAKRALYEWTRRLALKHVIDIYTLSCADHEFCDIRPFVQKQYEFQFVSHTLYDSPLGRLNQLQRWRDLGEMSVISHQIADEIDAKGYDVVFANTCTFTSIPSLLQFLRTPSVFYLHEPFGRTYVRQVERPYRKSNRIRKLLDGIDPLIWLYNRRLDTIQYKSVWNTKTLLANSLFTQKQMKIAFNVETSVSYYGVDTDGFYPMPNVSKKNYLLSVGELTPRKGFDFLVESLAQLPPAQRLELRLACNWVDCFERDYVQNLASQRGVELKILTNLNTKELCLQYNQAQLCIYSPVLEPFGLVPLESMACGTPVVGVREGGVRETVVDGHTGLLADRDPAEFAAAIVRLLDNPSLAAQMGRQGSACVKERWTWEEAVETLDRHLTQVASSAILS